MDVGHPRLLGRQGRRAVEPAGQPGLAAAVGARAEPAQRREVVAAGVAVGPVDRERAQRPGRRGSSSGDRSATAELRAWPRAAPPRDSIDGIPLVGSPGHHRTSRDHRPGATRLGPGYPRAGEPPDRRSPQDVRVRRRPRRAVVRGARRPDLRLPRCERRGQDDDDADRARRARARTPAASSGTAPTRASCRGATWGYLPEERGLYPRMVVLDQLVFFASLHGVPRDIARRDALAWLHRFRVTDLAERKAEELSARATSRRSS